MWLILILICSLGISVSRSFILVTLLGVGLAYALDILQASIADITVFERKCLVCTAAKTTLAFHDKNLLSGDGVLEFMQPKGSDQHLARFTIELIIYKINLIEQYM